VFPSGTFLNKPVQRRKYGGTIAGIIQLHSLLNTINKSVSQKHNIPSAITQCRQRDVS
jgi:hypothetical protein